MKRKEMLEIMMASYVKEIPYHEDGGIQLQRKLLRLLDDMEEAGMLPPWVGIGEEKDYGFLEYVPKWEQDD